MEKLTSRAYRYIRDAIQSGRLEPGTPLSRRGFAEELGMSPVPVGEALALLVSEGFIESRPRAGTRVKIPTADEVRGNYELREALETHSARLFAECATANERRRLTAFARRLDAGYNEEMHQAFHRHIAACSDCPQLANEIERSRVLFLNSLFSLTGEHFELPPDWHSRLAHVLTTGSPGQAAEAMRRHVRYRKDAVIDKFARMGRTDRLTRRPRRRPE